MPYSSTEDLPDQTKDLSSSQKRAFMHAFNSALESGKDEKSAFKIAWSAANGVSKHLPGKHDQSDHGSWAKKITGGMTKEKREGILKEINSQGGGVQKTLDAANQWLMKMGKNNSIEFGVTVDDKGVARDVFMGREGVVRFRGEREPGLMGFLRGKRMDRLHLTHLHPIKEGGAAAYKPLSEQDVLAATLTGAKSITAVTPQGLKTTFEIKRPEDRKQRRKQLRKVFNAIGEHEVTAFTENWSGLMSDDSGWSGFNETRRNIKEFKESTDRSQRVRIDHASRKSDKKWDELLNSIPGVTYKSGKVEKIVKRVGDANENNSYAKNMDELTIEGEIAKIDDDQRQIFGWASVTEINGEPVVDLQGDVMETYELEKAAYDYVLNSRVGGEMHERVGKTSPKQIGTLIESMVITPEKIEKMGLPDSTPHGWWIGFQVDRDDVGEGVWKKVRKGDYTGFSIHGLGKREPMEKHLIGRHNQKDHGRRHSRKEHEGFFRSGRAAELRRDLADRAARLAEEEPRPKPKPKEEKKPEAQEMKGVAGERSVRITEPLPWDDVPEPDERQLDLFDEWATTFDRASEVYEDNGFEYDDELESLTGDLMRIERELEGHLEKKMTGISKGVMTRDPSAYIEWLEKISSVSGITPRQIDQDLRAWMKEEGDEDPDDDDVHDFLITAYGSGEEGDVTKAVIKHLIGRHDQESHGRRDHNTGREATRSALSGAIGGGAGGAAGTALFGPDSSGPPVRRAAALWALLGGSAGLLGGAIRGAREGGQEAESRRVAEKEPEYRPDLSKPTTVSGVAGPMDTRSRHDIRRQRDEEEQGVMRKILIYKARERAKTQEEFAANVEEIGKVFEDTDPELSMWFMDVHKHLIGRHEQNDHDPTKKGKHTRDQHKGRSPTGATRNPSMAGAVGGLAGAGLGMLRGASMGPAGLIGGALGGALGAGGLGYQIGGGQIFGNPNGSRAGGIAAGAGNIMVGGMGGIAPAARRLIHGDPNAMYAQQRQGKRQKKLNKRQREVLAKYLGPIGDEDAE